jgi:glucosylglycerate phosphorylase
MLEKLQFVYGTDTGREVADKLQTLIQKYTHLKTAEPAVAPAERLTERDALLITYGDMVQSEPGKHLQTLHKWCNERLKGIINTVHILPFFPYTSDDGFSVVDYRQIDPALGDWGDVRAMHADFRLMFDAVVNHISASSAWFQGFLAGDPTYEDYFIVTDPTLDLSGVTRPRALPLLTRFQTAQSEKYLWTTFSTDQLDINFRNPEVFLNITELLMFYVSQGADLIRLDAIGYLWKEIGTSCIHLPQTHALIQVMRAALDECAPNALLVTETNVPHKDNISYFGDGQNEAQMVYQFPLVPLVLHTLQTGDATHLKRWATGLDKLSDTTTFFNFLASHDGIGVVPAKGILSEAEVNALVERTLARGGKVSYKNNPDGSQSPYELNITYFDAISDPADDEETKIARFMASQAIMLAMQGVPGIYFHSLLGSSSWQEGFAQTERNRTLNRQKFDYNELEKLLNDPSSRAAKVFARYSHLLQKRTAHPAFHPNANQEILPLENPALFGLLRTAQDGRHIMVLQNVSDKPAMLHFADAEEVHDLVSDQTLADLKMTLAPYQTRWLEMRHS